MDNVQKAISVPFNTVDGSLNVSELNSFLAQGWTVNTTQYSSGHLLVILDPPKQPEPAPPATS